MIEDVEVKQLKFIPDERGKLMEILRCDDDIFKKFGQVYVTTTYPEVVKAWHIHKIQSDNICCIKGMIKVVLYDGRDKSPTKGEVNEFSIGDHNTCLIFVPPGVYHGWKCISKSEAFVINTPTEAYNRETPDEYRLRPDTKEIPYDWQLTPGKRHG